MSLGLGGAGMLCTFRCVTLPTSLPRYLVSPQQPTTSFVVLYVVCGDNLCSEVRSGGRSREERFGGGGNGQKKVFYIFFKKNAQKRCILYFFVVLCKRRGIPTTIAEPSKNG